MRLINSYGQDLSVNDPASVAYILSQGGSIVRDDGTLAVLMVHGNQWNPASIYIDGVALETFLNPPPPPPPVFIPPPVVSPGSGGAVMPANGVFAANGKPYRLIIPTSPGRVDTGATYVGCSQQNPAACIPVQFATIQAANDYAIAHDEVPHLIGSAEEAWAIVEGRQTISTVSPGLLIGGALALWYFLKRRR